MGIYRFGVTPSSIAAEAAEKKQAYETQRMSYDAARPFAVVATFRKFNTVVARYADEKAAKRRARAKTLARLYARSLIGALLKR